MPSLRLVLTSSLTFSPGLYSRLSVISSMSLKRKSLAVEALAAHHEDVAALDGVLLAVGQLVRQPILAGLGRLDLLPGPCPRRWCPASRSARPSRPARLVVVADLVERQLALALRPASVERLGLKLALIGVAGAVVAAVDPGEDLERLAATSTLPVPTMVRRDSSTTSAVIVYWWSWLPCSSLAGSVSIGTLTVPSGPICDLVLDHDFRRLAAAAPPPDRDGPAAAPVAPAGIPGVVGGEPPVAPAVEPVPAAGGYQLLAVAGAQHLVLDLGLGDRGAEVVFAPGSSP